MLPIGDGVTLVRPEMTRRRSRAFTPHAQAPVSRVTSLASPRFCAQYLTEQPYGEVADTLTGFPAIASSSAART